MQRPPVGGPAGRRSARNPRRDSGAGLTRTYIVAATPRTGSSLLCEGLWETEIAGRPGEVFAPDFRHLWYRHWMLNPNADFESYVRMAVLQGTTANGVFGFKIQWMHVAVLADDLGLPSQRMLDSVFPGAVFVNTVRGDRAAQARSWERAISTGEWWRFRDAPASASPRADPEEVRRLKAEIERQQSAWERYFDQRGIEPLTVRYEELDADYRGEVGRVLRFLELDASAAQELRPPRLVRQSDQHTRDGMVALAGRFVRKDAAE